MLPCSDQRPVAERAWTFLAPAKPGAGRRRTLNANIGRGRRLDNIQYRARWVRLERTLHSFAAQSIQPVSDIFPKRHDLFGRTAIGQDAGKHTIRFPPWVYKSGFGMPKSLPVKNMFRDETKQQT